MSGAHFNPVVTLVDRGFGATTSRDTVLYIVAQIIGGCLGAILANVMFELPAVEWSTTARSSGALWLSEVVATAGLLLVIHGCVRSGRKDVVAFAVGLWIGGAYWFTSSTSFANPAVTIARTMSNTFAGIKPSSAPMFIVMQLIGAAIAFALVRYLYLYRHRAARRPLPRDYQPTEELPMPNLDSLSLDQQLALRSAAKTLHSEFDDFFSTETIELFLQTSFDQFADRSTVKNFLPLLAERFARQRLRALAKVEGHTATATGRAVPVRPQRRPLTNGPRLVQPPRRRPRRRLVRWFRTRLGDQPLRRRGDGRSRHRHHRRIPQAMDRRDRPSRRRRDHDGLRRRLPLYPGKRYEDWELDDPAGQSVEAVRPIRDEIRAPSRDCSARSSCRSPSNSARRSEGYRALRTQSTVVLRASETGVG